MHICLIPDALSAIYFSRVIDTMSYSWASPSRELNANISPPQGAILGGLMLFSPALIMPTFLILKWPYNILSHLLERYYFLQAQIDIASPLNGALTCRELRISRF